MSRIKRLCGAVAVAASLLLTPGVASAQNKIKLGLLPFSESLAAVIADKQGFFKEEGIEVEISKFDSGAVAVPVLQSGRLDIVLSSTVATFQAIEQGLDAVVLAPGIYEFEYGGPGKRSVVTFTIDSGERRVLRQSR